MEKPLFWYRPVGDDGGYEGPVHNNSTQGKELRDAKPHEWEPLFAKRKVQPLKVDLTSQTNGLSTLNPIDEKAFNQFCRFAPSGEEKPLRELQRESYAAALSHRDQQASTPLGWVVLTRDEKIHKVTSSKEKAEEKMKAQLDRFMWKDMSVQPIYLYQAKANPVTQNSWGSLPAQTPVFLSESEMKIFRLGWLECEAAYRQIGDQITQQHSEPVVEKASEEKGFTRLNKEEIQSWANKNGRDIDWPLVMWLMDQMADRNQEKG